MVKSLWGRITAAFAVFFLSACGAASGTVSPSAAAPAGEVQGSVSDVTGYDPTFTPREGIGVIYLAGGCFWGLEKLMQSLPGVESAVSGYANGSADVIPDYKQVSGGDTGYRETVRVEYRKDEVSLDALLFAYFMVIDPTVENRQGNDIGTQYQTGVYYRDEAAGETVRRIAAIERERTPRFVVEIAPLQRFYDAEEYHQEYLDKNPYGYCHISRHEMAVASEMLVDPGRYRRPPREQLRELLNDQQFLVTQEAATEPAFMNEYWENHERGIYVDVVTGEPLFSSSDKYDSGTGWPSFSRPIDYNTIRELEDLSHGMVRVEARSRAGNSHLGHVFHDDPSSPSNTRYCINSAALRFVPFDEMDAQGYGYLKEYVK